MLEYLCFNSLKEDEMAEFQSLLSSLKKLNDSEDYRFWSIDFLGRFTVKALSAHQKTASPMDKHLFTAIWKSSSQQRINVLIWIMVFESLDSSETLQRKSPNKCLLPLICPLCIKANEDLLHLSMPCSFSSFWWGRIFSLFNFDLSFLWIPKCKCASATGGPSLSKKSCLIRENLSKALLTVLWFECNQLIFHDKERPRAEIVCSVEHSAAAWCSLNKEFESYSIQEICLNWTASLSQPAF